MELAIRLEQNPFHFYRLNMALTEPRQTYKVPDLPLRQSTLPLSLHPALVFGSLSLFFPSEHSKQLENAAAGCCPSSSSPLSCPLLFLLKMVVFQARRARRRLLGILVTRRSVSCLIVTVLAQAPRADYRR